MTSPRLAYVCADPGIPPDGTKGASVHFRELGRALEASGIDVTAVTRRPPAGEWTDFRLHSASAGKSRERDQVAAELGDLIDQREVTDLLRAAPSFDAVYERYSLFGLAGLRFARSAGIPFFLEVNAPLWEEARTYRSLVLAGLAHSVARELMTHATRVLVVSEGMRDRVIDEGVDPDHVVVFPNGVAPAFLEPIRPADRPEALEGRTVITFIGSLKPWHGVDMLLDAFLDLPERLDVALWVVGDGPEADRVDAAANRHPRRIVRTTAVPHEMVPSVLRASDLTVAPYTRESPSYFCPLKVIEAFAVGVPLLASDVPAVRRLDLRGLTYHAFEPGCASSFRSAVEKIVPQMDAVRQRAAMNREAVQERFTWTRRAEELKSMMTEWRLASSRHDEVA